MRQKKGEAALGLQLARRWEDESLGGGYFRKYGKGSAHLPPPNSRELGEKEGWCSPLKLNSVCRSSWLGMGEGKG